MTADDDTPRRPRPPAPRTIQRDDQRARRAAVRTFEEQDELDGDTRQAVTRLFDAIRFEDL